MSLNPQNPMNSTNHATNFGHLHNLDCNTTKRQIRKNSNVKTRADKNLLLFKHEGKSLNNRNFIIKCMEKYAQRKILLRDIKWLLSSMPYRGRDDRAVWACAIARTTWPFRCQLAPWKRAAKPYSFFVVRGCETLWRPVVTSRAIVAKIQTSYILPAHFIYKFWMRLVTNSNFSPLRHRLVGSFYQWDGEFLLRGKRWFFI